MSLEAGLVIVSGVPAYLHLPAGRSAGGLPDSRDLWDVLWKHRLEKDLGFAHSHPGSGAPLPSHTDLTTFAAIESGLGRRLRWWITSADATTELEWRGPDRLFYRTYLILDEPFWTAMLRKHSEGEQP